MKHKLLTIGLVLATGMAALLASAQSAQPSPEVMRLWNESAPGAVGNEDKDIPTLTLYRPAEGKANGAAIVVCPGGGYGGLAGHEGKPIAEWLNTLGVTGIVLKYRLAPAYKHPTMMNDVNRALRFVRAHSSQWKLDANRIGVLGFSAGGHLASTSATHFTDGNPNAADTIERVSSRPDVAILLYPVITMTDPFTHQGSRRNLLGEKPDEALINLMSNEKQVTAKTPPCFIVHTADDSVVPMENALMFAAACRKAKVPVELHIYEQGRHGLGLGGGDAIFAGWTVQCAKWLERRGFFKASK